MKSKEFYELTENTLIPNVFNCLDSYPINELVFKADNRDDQCRDWVNEVQQMETELLDYLKGNGRAKPDINNLIVQFMKLYLLDSIGNSTYENLKIYVTETTIPRCLKIMKSKGDVYSGDVDKLKNFKDVAKDAGITILQAWIVFFNKHYRSILAWCGGDYRDSEPISGRIDDAINYLLLLVGILMEKEEKQYVLAGVTFGKLDNKIQQFTIKNKNKESVKPEDISYLRDLLEKYDIEYKEIV
jgi:hypothetical protein